MAAYGGNAFQEKVSRLLSREHGKPVLKPNRTLALRDAVANRKLKKGGKTRTGIDIDVNVHAHKTFLNVLASHTFSTEATCITEMSVMMACWKRNNFVDGLCSNETSSFYKCVQDSQVGTHRCVHVVL